MEKEHHYRVDTEWTGNTGNGTNSYQGYERSYKIRISNKPDIEGSSDPAFRGDETRYNPEELLVASIASCHMLWYLHLCAEAGIVVTGYSDRATGTMSETASGTGRFTGVVLHPMVQVKSIDMVALAGTLHAQANACCFIANSLNFKVNHVHEIHVSNG